MIERRWESKVAELVAMRVPTGHVMIRETCPHHQGWLVLKGSWSDSAAHIRSGDFASYAPFERSRRVAEEPVFAIGIRFFAEMTGGLGWASRRLLWGLAAEMTLGETDAWRLDDLVALAQDDELSDPRAPSWLLSVRDRLHEETDGVASLGDLAVAAGISPNHLSTRFREHFGVTISTYRRRLRLERGLHSSAHESGFYDASHFHRVCRAELGLSPSQIARILREA